MAGAQAQTGRDCDYAPFSLRTYPFSVVEGVIRSTSADPNNTIIGSVFARCEAGTRRVFVCGVQARESRTGYVDRTVRFFGHYDAATGGFQVVSRGEKADSSCLAKVYSKG
ncbi:MAG: hypothetical protein K2Z25_21000 [Beijerinckiaceae bacterium]|nr:hypothetical protein [Beijerinckiaceae bacterium]